MALCGILIKCGLGREFLVCFRYVRTIPLDNLYDDPEAGSTLQNEVTGTYEQRGFHYL